MRLSFCCSVSSVTKFFFLFFLISALKIVGAYRQHIAHPGQRQILVRILSSIICTTRSHSTSLSRRCDWEIMRFGVFRRNGSARPSPAASLLYEVIREKIGFEESKLTMSPLSDNIADNPVNRCNICIHKQIGVFGRAVFITNRL